MTAQEAARDVVRRTLAKPPSLGTGRLLCIDGPAGSGKTTVAAAVLESVPDSVSVRVVHLDDLYPGWSGLVEGVDRVAHQVVAPLARGETGRYRRYDWATDEEAEWCEVGPVDLLVLEGVGAGAACYSERITTLVWVEAPREVRLDRGLSRDSALAGRTDADDDLRANWLRWMKQEQELFARERTRERADVLVDGTASP